jgi:hypothetical protein
LHGDKDVGAYHDSSPIFHAEYELHV